VEYGISQSFLQSPGGIDMRTYVIHVHGIKSALANIGKMDVSAVAMKLETSGRDGNIAIITSETPAFLDSLRAVIQELTPEEEISGGCAASDEDLPYLHEKLLAIKAACEEYDESTADENIAKLREKAWSQPVRELLDIIAEHLLHSDFDEIADAVEKFTAK